jgi:hypothetical protein
MAAETPRNPYSPPAAVVFDAPEVMRERPGAITRAFVFIGCNFVVTFIAIALDWRHMSSVVSPIVFATYEFVAVGVFVWLLAKIWAGRNWARITYLIVEGVTLPAASWSLPEIAARSPVVAGLHLMMIGLDLAVFYLLFFPGRVFFKPLPR